MSVKNRTAGEAGEWMIKVAVIAGAYFLIWIPAAMAISFIEAWILYAAWWRSVVPAFEWPSVDYWQCWWMCLGLQVYFSAPFTQARAIAKAEKD